MPHEFSSTVKKVRGPVRSFFISATLPFNMKRRAFLFPSGEFWGDKQGLEEFHFAMQAEGFLIPSGWL